MDWLEDNKEVLGFKQSAAYLLITAANFQLTGSLDDSQALKISRQLWSHSVDNHRAIGTGEADWHTPLEYLSAAREVI